MSLKVQQQIKRNAEDIREYITELYKWEGKIDSKKNKQNPNKPKKEVN